MSFAQSTTADNIPVGLQNGYANLHLVDNVAGSNVTSVTWANSKNLTLNLPLGNYHAYGTIRIVNSNLSVTQGLQLQVNGSNTLVDTAVVPPGSTLFMPVCFSFIVSGLSNTIAVNLYSSAGTSSVQSVDLLFIKIA